MTGTRGATRRAATTLPPLGPATVADLADVQALVAAAGLPLAGLVPCVAGGTVVVCRDPDGHLLGVASTERHGDAALLRSVAVVARVRGNGIGRALVAHALADARAAGAREAWLLTETAESFFALLGWARAAREDAPPAIAGSVEFATACPATAVAMRRTL